MNNQNELMGYGFISDSEVLLKSKKEIVFTIKIVSQRINKKGFGRNKLYILLRTLGYINDGNYAYEKYVNEGYFINSETTRKIGLVYKRTNQILVTVNGLNLIRKVVEEHVT